MFSLGPHLELERNIDLDSKWGVTRCKSVFQHGVIAAGDDEF
jgi:hypothetical protein